MVKLAAARPTEFKCYAPQAKRVSLAGTFNDWNTKAISARKDSKGSWTVKVNLKPGKYEYKFFVDGSWVNDPKCSACIPNVFGSKNCVLEIK